MFLLKQSTAVTVDFGPIVDSVDATAETGQTITQTDILLRKAGATSYSAKNDATSATHRSSGMYTAPFDATDTGTVGPMTLLVAKTGTMVSTKQFMVVTANWFDAMVGADKLWVDTVEINSSSAAAVLQALAANAMASGTTHTSGGTTTGFSTPDIVEATTDHFKGRTVIFTSGALILQASGITGYSLASARGTFVINTLTEAVPNSTGFLIV